jgi:site-specific DNA-cytosine methylase
MRPTSKRWQVSALACSVRAHEDWRVSITDINHYHGFCGIGSGAAGFNDAEPKVGPLAGKMVCIGGFDVDEKCVRDFHAMTGVHATQLDAFSMEQYMTFHGKRPPPGWHEATAADLHRSAGHRRPHIVFLSSPCKGLSGLLSQALSTTPRYVALNELTLRGVWLMLEAWADDPPELVVFENVPRIASRGRYLLDQIVALLRHYGYAVNETTHDCGEIGGLAQSRKRFLLVARHERKVPAFLYEPEKRTLRAVGDVLGKMPLPGDEIAGPMHRVPSLQWKTWVRLAFVKAGSDWRSLNELAVEDGVLRDYLIVPDMHRGMLGVNQWSEPAGTVLGSSRASNGNFSVGDPRMEQSAKWNHGQQYGVQRWEDPTGTVTGQQWPNQGRFAVQDPRAPLSDFNGMRVVPWDDTAGVVTGSRSPGGTAQSVADPRLPPSEGRHESKYRVTEWTDPSRTIGGSQQVGSGAGSVADPRLGLKHNNCFRVVRFDQAAGTVTGGGHPSAGGQGVADPRPGWERHGNNMTVGAWDKPSRTVIAGGKGVQGGWLSVADPRAGIQREKGDHYLTGGHYGVVPWESTSGAISAAARHDNGHWSVADPRMPSATEKLVCRIQSLDGTWHRPFTTLELAALQSLFDPEEHWELSEKARWVGRRDRDTAGGRFSFQLEGASDSRHREVIGNAVPRKAAKAIGTVMGETLLLAWTGETFILNAQPVWVRPIALALTMPGIVQ